MKSIKSKPLQNYLRGGLHHGNNEIQGEDISIHQRGSFADPIGQLPCAGRLGVAVYSSCSGRRQQSIIGNFLPALLREGDYRQGRARYGGARFKYPAARKSDHLCPRSTASRRQETPVMTALGKAKRSVNESGVSQKGFY